ncbi:MAG: hypothetical protein GC202_11745 [Alphaproteobacteria bacterium]|nr:hypothetical protein [Alphaproteobacteria bacterium]
MNFEELRREGSTPAIYPNAGQCRYLCWTREDAGRYGEILKKAFPNILFYRDLGYRASRPEKPELVFLDRLDSLDADTRVEAVFPYPGWKPELVWEAPSWHWKNYLSPIIMIGINTYDRIQKIEWSGVATDRPIENYFSTDIKTSYRRQIADEVRIQSKVIRLADQMCVRTISVIWMSYADYLAKRGKIWGKRQVYVRHVTHAVMDWYRAAPGRMIDFSGGRDGWGITNVPVDEIPDEWWKGKIRPKWTQRR